MFDAHSVFKFFNHSWWMNIRACSVWSSCWESAQLFYFSHSSKIMINRVNDEDANAELTHFSTFQCRFNMINRSWWELDMRWLDHRFSTSKTEFSFQNISVQIARLRCECLSTQLVRCFLDSDIVAHDQLRDISACNQYEEKRNVWRS